MNKFSMLLTLSLSSSLVFAGSAEKPLPLNYNFADQKTQATETIAPQDADIVKTAYKDLDEDGVADKLDHCPNTILNAEVDSLGCELDSDADKVVNRLDQCPDTPPGAKVNRFGCETDSDNDGVVDSKDLCPDTPEGAEVNADGCETKAIVLTNIVFDTWEHAIRNDQRELLLRDAAALNKLKDGEVLLITGHTDSQASEALNERLSWRRANSTKQFLIEELKLDGDRIYINGKGELEPISDNTTAAGRQENRRIEMAVIKAEEVPANATKTISQEMMKR